MLNLIDDILGLFHPSAQRQIALQEIPTSQAAQDFRQAAVNVAHPEELALTDSAMQLIERDEGDRLRAYQDVVGVWTIGYGHTGPDVTPGLVITEDQARALLASDLHTFESGVQDYLAGSLVATSNNEFSAMVSLSYNVGLGNFKMSSVLRFHKMGRFDDAANAFLLWDKAGGQVYPGLVRRRHQERELYLGLAIDP